MQGGRWPVDEVESVPGLADEAVIGLTREPLGLPSPHASAVGQTRRHAIPVKPFGNANVCLRKLLVAEATVRHPVIFAEFGAGWTICGAHGTVAFFDMATFSALEAVASATEAFVELSTPPPVADWPCEVRET